MALILSPRDAVDAPGAGGKARALARASARGLPVPPWVVVPAAALLEVLAPDDRASLERAPSFDEARAIVGRAKVEGPLADAIAGAVARLAPDAAPLAVRSSAADEDGVSQSFAGQLESVLPVSPADVPAAVAAVWRSAFAPRVESYRAGHGLPRVPSAPGVIVQRMVRPRAAGVAFSADPVSGRRGVAVVSAVRGLGTSLVGGEADADTWTVDRAAAIVDRRTPETPALSDEEVRSVAALARRVARFEGRPQDVEWAIDGEGALWLLQARPITSLAGRPDPDAPPVLWDNSNIVESYSGVTTPLTFSFAAEIYEHVYRQFCRLMQVPPAVVESHDDVFRNMLGLVRGRLYYNLLNWYRVLAMLPGYRVNRRFMEQMMGVREGLPPELAEQVRPPAGGRVRDALRLARTMAGLVASHVTLPGRVSAFTRRLDEALAPPDPPLSGRRPDELVAHYRELRGRLLLKWDAPLVNDFFAMIFYGLLRRLVQKWGGDEGGTLQNDLIGGEGGLVSAEPAVRLREMARVASEVPGLADVLRDGSREAIDDAMAAAPAFRAGFDAYLEKFGERTVNELKLESETLHDDPLPLLRAVGRLAGRDMDHAAVAAAPGIPARDEAQRRVEAALAGRPLRRLVFNWVLRHARHRVRDRENLRLERTRLFGRVRRIFLELGRRFHAEGLLDGPRDVFYLEVDEVLAFADGRASSTDLRGLVALRSAEFRRYESMPPPADRFTTRGPVYVGHEFQDVRAASPEAASRDERRGLGCSPGVVRGRVRVVADPRTVTLDAPAVLVAAHTDPGWIVIFPSALGLLVERGSLLSHAAIVARELGIPAVVSLPGLTAWLRDGDLVELDGATGVVRRLEEAATPGADGAE